MDYMLASPGVPTCLDCSMIVRPDVVLYEEALDHDLLARAADLVSQADTLIIGGTSLAVFPAAGLVQAFRGRHLILINRDPTPADRLATLVIRAPIGQALAPD
jgi:NAD-dependent deacetylase